MQTPTRGPTDHIPAPPRAAKPPRREQDLIVIPEAPRPPRRGLIAAIVGTVLTIVVIASLSLYAIDQRERADTLEGDLTTALADQGALVDAAAASRERILVLESRVAVLDGDLRRARQGRDVAAASRQEARQNLQQARQALEQEQERLRSYLGPVIEDGAHAGRLVAVGADQAPARITFALARWFTGSAATAAAIEDGVIVADGRRARYFRNDDVIWRTVPVDPVATITVGRFGAGRTYSIGLGELQRLMRADSRRAERVTNDPFQLTIVDGRITALRQLRYP
ncbi:hypothetical protein BH18ACT17_BH18ACT17_10570 [soil metagenome]